jgi:hypothetical protein
LQSGGGCVVTPSRTVGGRRGGQPCRERRDRLGVTATVPAMRLPSRTRTSSVRAAACHRAAEGDPGACRDGLLEGVDERGEQFPVAVYRVIGAGDLADDVEPPHGARGEVDDGRQGELAGAGEVERCSTARASKTSPRSGAAVRTMTPAKASAMSVNATSNGADGSPTNCTQGGHLAGRR